VGRRATELPSGLKFRCCRTISLDWPPSAADHRTVNSCRQETISISLGLGREFGALLRNRYVVVSVDVR